MICLSNWTLFQALNTSYHVGEVIICTSLITVFGIWKCNMVERIIVRTEVFGFDYVERHCWVPWNMMVV